MGRKVTNSIRINYVETVGFEYVDDPTAPTPVADWAKYPKIGKIKAPHCAPATSNTVESETTWVAPDLPDRGGSYPTHPDWGTEAYISTAESEPERGS